MARRLFPLLALLLAAVPARSPAEEPDLGRVDRLIISLTNDFRAEQKRSELAISTPLSKAAQDFADYLAGSDKFSHTADGKDPSRRAKEHGYDYCIVAENIAYEFNSTGWETRQLAREFVRGWQNSPEHRKNMLDADVTEIGVGAAYSRESGRYYAVQEFGRPRSKAFTFKISNHAGAPVRYRVEDHAYTLKPDYTMTHTVCRPPAVHFEWAEGQTAAGGPDRVYQPAPGGRLVVRRAADGTIEVADK